MRLAGICNIYDANKFLKGFLSKYSLMFAVPPANLKNLHKALQADLDLNWVFAFREERVISNDFTISFKNRVFLINEPSIALKRKRVTVLKNLKGEVKILLNNRFVEFEEITKDTLNYLRQRKQKMKATIKKINSKTWKPASNHPWRLQNRALFKELRGS